MHLLLRQVPHFAGVFYEDQCIDLAWDKASVVLIDQNHWIVYTNYAGQRRRLDSRDRQTGQSCAIFAIATILSSSDKDESMCLDLVERWVRRLND